MYIDGNRPHNKSSIVLSDFDRPHKQSDSRQKIYAYKSRMEDHMNDLNSGFSATGTKFYNNKIFNSTHKYEVPIESDIDIKNESYTNFYSSHQRFRKPYGENTKFTDTLNKNQSLLRRGQFNIPIQKEQTSYLKKISNANRIFKYLNKPQKHQSIDLRKSYIKEKQFSPNLFDKTIATHFFAYNKLVTKQKKNKSQIVAMNNSMNRLLAEEMISFKLRPRAKHIKTIEN